METKEKVQGNGSSYLSISHEVENYSSWKKGFDEHQVVRKEAGIRDIFVKREADKENSITAFFEILDLDKAKSFLFSPELKEAMSKAGVRSEPALVFYNCASEYESVNAESFVTTVSHRVKDFATWKSIYDNSAALRKKGGTNDYLLLRTASDENEVTVLGTASSEEKFMEFVSNPELKGAMEAAGVISKPEIRVLH